MNRKGFAVFVVLIIVGPQAISAGVPSAEAADNQPNIVVILVDDLQMNALPYLPRLKALMADQGTTFNDFFVPTPICCPSRTSLLTGEYAHNHKVFTNSGSNGGFERFQAVGNEANTIAVLLKNNGYHTALIGKYLNEYTAQSLYIPSGWDDWYSHNGGGGTVTGFDYDMNENGRLVHYGSAVTDYTVDVMTRKAVEVIGKAQQPLFLYLAPASPHATVDPPPRYKDALPGITAPRTPSFDEKDVSDKPAWVKHLDPINPAQATSVNVFDDEGSSGALTVDAHFRERIQASLPLEDMVSDVIGALSAKHILNNTYIFFVSDNGYHSGEHRIQAGKRTAYEEAIRVPLFVRGPNIPAGSTRDHFVLMHDLTATFADLAGLPIPLSYDGKSIRPLLLSGADTSQTGLNQWRRRFLIEHWAGDDELTPFSEPSAQAVRTRTDKYIEYANGEKEYYDLETDPYELVNQVANPLYAARITPLISWLANLRTCKGQICRDNEGPGLVSLPPPPPPLPPPPPPLLPPPPIVVSPPPIAPNPSAKFQVGDSVETIANLNVRTLPSTSGSILGVQRMSARGVVTGVRQYGNGLWWWNINYEVNADGWSAEDFLVRISASSPPPPSSRPIFSRDLYYGLQHPDVLELQKLLQRTGFYGGPMTGGYFELTTSAVKSFQQYYAISPTGYVGPLTRRVLNTLP